MKGTEFLRKLKRLARANRVPYREDPEHGKGSHGRVWYGGESTTLKDRKKEIGQVCLMICASNSGSNGPI